MSVAAIGIDERVDAEGRRHAWRVVVRTERRTLETTMALPRAATYLQPPRHHHHGDLTLLSTSPADGMTRVIDELVEARVETVAMANEHVDSPLARALGWNGIATKTIDIPWEGDLREDPYSIGGDAGHEIAHITRALKGKA